MLTEPDFGFVSGFWPILTVLKISVTDKSIGLVYDEKMSRRTISPRNRAVGVGNRPETGGELRSRRAPPPKLPTNFEKNREKHETTHRKPTQGAGVGSLEKAPYGREKRVG